MILSFLNRISSSSFELLPLREKSFVLHKFSFLKVALFGRKVPRRTLARNCGLLQETANQPQDHLISLQGIQWAQHKTNLAFFHQHHSQQDSLQNSCISQHQPQPNLLLSWHESHPDRVTFGATLNLRKLGKASHAWLPLSTSSRRYGSPCLQHTNLDNMSETKVPKGCLPNGYSFVPKGNVFITSNCRKKTQESGRSVYLVIEGKKKQIGLGVPTEIYLAVQFKEMETRAERAANVVKRDEGMAKGFQKEIMNIFPQIPADALRNVAKIALQKGKGKVGRVGKLDVQRKAGLAVWAHIRHCETDYDALLKRGTPREEARKQVEAKIKEVCKAWGAGSQPTHGKSRKTSKSLTRPNIKSLQATKGRKKINPLEPKRITKTSSSRTAITSAASSKTSKKAGQFTNERNAAIRHARMAHRQKPSLGNLTQDGKKPTKQQQAVPKPSKPEVIATAASFRERRTPKPRFVLPPKVETKKINPNMLDLDREQRGRIFRRFAQIKRIEHTHKISRKKRRRSDMTSLDRIESLNNEINEILTEFSIQVIECSAAARQELCRRLRRYGRAS